MQPCPLRVCCFFLFGRCSFWVVLLLLLLSLSAGVAGSVLFASLLIRGRRRLVGSGGFVPRVVGGVLRLRRRCLLLSVLLCRVLVFVGLRRGSSRFFRGPLCRVLVAVVSSVPCCLLPVFGVLVLAPVLVAEVFFFMPFCARAGGTPHSRYARRQRRVQLIDVSNGFITVSNRFFRRLSRKVHCVLAQRSAMFQYCAAPFAVGPPAARRKSNYTLEPVSTHINATHPIYQYLYLYYRITDNRASITDMYRNFKRPRLPTAAVVI